MTEETKRGRKPDPRSKALYPWHRIQIPGYAKGDLPSREDVVRAREEGDTGPEALIRQPWAELCWAWPSHGRDVNVPGVSSADQPQWPAAKEYGRVTTVYKLVYEYYFNGGEALPEGARLYGTCPGKAACLNPLHREEYLTTEDTCRKGHPRTEENTYVSPQGARTCKVCRTQTVKRYTERRKADIAHKYRAYITSERELRHHRFNNDLVAMTDKEYIAHLEEVAGEWERQRWQIESLKAKLGEETE